MKNYILVFGALFQSMSCWAGRSAGTTGIQTRLYNWQTVQNSCYLSGGARYTIESQSPGVAQDVTVSIKNERITYMGQSPAIQAPTAPFWTLLTGSTTWISNFSPSRSSAAASFTITLDASTPKFTGYFGIMCVPQPTTFSCVYSSSTSSTDGYTQIMQNGSAMGAMAQVKFPNGEVSYTASLNFDIANDKGAILASVETNLSMCGWAGMIQSPGTYRVNAGRPF